MAGGGAGGMRHVVVGLHFSGTHSVSKEEKGEE